MREEGDYDNDNEEDVDVAIDMKAVADAPNEGSISGNRCSLINRMECQKWWNITRKFGVTSTSFYVGLVLSGMCLTHA